MPNQFKTCIALRVPLRLCPAIQALRERNHVPDFSRLCISHACPNNSSGGDIGVGQPVHPEHAQLVADTPDQCGKRKRSPSLLPLDTITEFSADTTTPEGIADVLSILLPSALPRFDFTNRLLQARGRRLVYMHSSPRLKYICVYRGSCLRKKVHVALACVGAPPLFLHFSEIKITALQLEFFPLRRKRFCPPPPLTMKVVTKWMESLLAADSNIMFIEGEDASHMVTASWMPYFESEPEFDLLADLARSTNAIDFHDPPMAELSWGLSGAQKFLQQEIQTL